MTDLRERRADLLMTLKGEGIEIGAYHSPLPVPPGARVTYVDRYSATESEAVFPEAANSARVVRPEILASADDLPMLGDRSQDFVLASHLLEHLPDPVGALAEWHRVLRPGGSLVLFLPDQRFTFDRRRALTTLSHVLEDHALPPSSPDRMTRDREHYLEWARVLNGLVDPRQAELWADLLQAASYPIHFHCWTLANFRELIHHLAAHTTVRFVIEQEVEVLRSTEFGLRARTG